MADLDLKVLLTIKDKATRDLKRFNKELERTKKNMEAVSKTSLKVSGVSRAGAGAGAGIGVAATATGAGLGTKIAGGAAVATTAMVGLNGAVAKVLKLLSELVFRVNLVGAAFVHFDAAVKRGASNSRALRESMSDVSQQYEDTEDDILRANKAIDKNSTQLEKNGKSADKNSSKQKKLSGSFSGLIGMVGKATLVFAGVATAIGLAITPLIRQASEYENLQAKLTAVVGSSEDAARAFALIKDTASKLPTTVAQTTEAFVKMQALGIVPTQERMIAFGNIAAAMGKDILQFAEAVADASTSEFERLKEFGIKAKQQGDKVSLTFQGVTTQIGNNSTEIIGYLEEIGRTKFGDAAALQMETLTGKSSNLADAFAELKNALGEGALLTAAKAFVTTLSDIVGWVNTNVGAIQRFSMVLVGMFARAWIEVKHVARISMISIGDVVNNMFVGIGKQVAKFVNGIKGVYNEIAEFTGIGDKLNIEPVIDVTTRLDTQLAELTKTRAREIAEHKAAMDLWNKDIPLTKEGTEVAKKYNEELNKKAAAQAKAGKATKVAAKAQEELNKRKEEGKELAKDLRTPIEVYRDTVKKLTKDLKDNVIGQETYNRALREAKDTASSGLREGTRTAREQFDQRLKDLKSFSDEGIITAQEYARGVIAAYQDLQDNTENVADKMQDEFRNAAQGMKSDMSSFFFDAMQGEFTNLASSFKKTIDRMVSDLLASELSSLLFGKQGVGGGGWGIVGQAGSFLSGLLPRAGGGYVPAGMPTLVGEERAEVIVPSVPSFVYPSVPAFQGAMGGQGDTHNHWNINAVDSSSFRDMIEKDDRWLVETMTDASRRYNKGSAF